LALAESGLKNVVSPANAVGVWQFLEETGKFYGLEVNSNVDERYHLEKSTRAACKYLKSAKEQFGSWTLAAASYNIGQARLKKIVEEQKMNSYYDLYLNDETSRYIFRITALKEVFNNPQKYGFYFTEDDLYQPMAYKIVQVDTTVLNLVDFALQHNANYKTLKILNPWLRQPKLENKSRKIYEIKIPS
jgi:membrane-bound lytic murein transglycosylase D